MSNLCTGGQKLIGPPMGTAIKRTNSASPTLIVAC